MTSSDKVKKIVLTGGGTAGHVFPHIAILPELKEQGWSVSYVGSYGLEKDLIQATGIPYRAISSGKLRRYVSYENMLDFFKVIFGCIQAFLYLRQEKPELVYSKGGFVSVPVAVAAWALRIPVITHESDYSPGLANRIIAKVAKVILYSFPETKKFIHGTKSCLTGIPIRSELRNGDFEQGLKLCKFDKLEKKPVVLVMGGSLGAEAINLSLKAALPELLIKFHVVHLCGRGKTIDFQREGYASFEFLSKELGDVLALADVVVGRAGANSIFELMALNKPMLLIPLERGSRGDQVQNANYFAKKNWAHMIQEAQLNADSFIHAIEHLFEAKEQVINSQKETNFDQAHLKVIEAINKF